MDTLNRLISNVLLGYTYLKLLALNDSNFPYKIKEISTEINDEITMHEHEWTEVKRELRNNLAIGITGVAAGIVSTLVMKEFQLLRY